MYTLKGSILNIANILPNHYSEQLFSDKPSKTILNFFSGRKVSNLHNTFLLIFFISNFIRDEIYVYYYLHIVHLLGDLTCYWHQASTFPLLLAHLSVCALPWMQKLYTLKESCLFLHFLTWWTGQSSFLDCFSCYFFKMKDLQLSALHTLVFLSKTRKSMNMPISANKKSTFFLE